MKHLLSLMEEFSIFNEPRLPADAGQTLSFSALVPQAPAPAPTEEYELDAEGNPVLDAQGNPIKKLGQAASPAVPGASCTCAHGEPGTPAVPDATGMPPALAPPALPPVPEDEFDFKV